MAGVRGVSWRRDEVLDLLSIWGEQSVQSALRESHRNKDVFEDVSRKMLSRGHTRNAEECRSKTKCMRQAYKKCLAHNEKSGNSPTLCPFYDQLNMILRGDPSVKRQRMSQSLPRETVADEGPSDLASIVLQPLMEGAEGGLLNAEALSEPSSEGLQGSGALENIRTEDAAEDHSEGDLDCTDSQDILDRGVPTEQQPKDLPPNNPSRHPDNIPPDVPLPDLSPTTRLAVRQEKRRKVSAMQRVGEQMLRQSAREHREMMLAGQREHKQLLEMLQISQEREDAPDTAITGLFHEALGCLSGTNRSGGNRTGGEMLEHREPSLGFENQSRFYRSESPMCNPLRMQKGQRERSGQQYSETRGHQHPIEASGIGRELTSGAGGAEGIEHSTNREHDEEFSESYVGTHVWGETQWDHNIPRPQFRPFPQTHNVRTNQAMSCSSNIRDPQSHQVYQVPRLGSHPQSSSAGRACVWEEEIASRSLLSPTSHAVKAGCSVKGTLGKKTEATSSTHIPSTWGSGPLITEQVRGNLPYAAAQQSWNTFPNFNEQNINSLTMTNRAHEAEPQPRNESGLLRYEDFMPMETSTQVSDLPLNDANVPGPSQKEGAAETSQSTAGVVSPGVGGKRGKKQNPPVQEEANTGRGKRAVKRKVIFSPTL